MAIPRDPNRLWALDWAPPSQTAAEIVELMNEAHDRIAKQFFFDAATEAAINGLSVYRYTVEDDGLRIVNLSPLEYRRLD